MRPDGYGLQREGFAGLPRRPAGGLGEPAPGRPPPRVVALDERQHHPGRHQQGPRVDGPDRPGRRAQLRRRHADTGHRLQAPHLHGCGLAGRLRPCRPDGGFARAGVHYGFRPGLELDGRSLGGAQGCDEAPGLAHRGGARRAGGHGVPETVQPGRRLPERRCGRAGDRCPDRLLRRRGGDRRQDPGDPEDALRTGRQGHFERRPLHAGAADRRRYRQRLPAAFRHPERLRLDPV